MPIIALCVLAAAFLLWVGVVHDENTASASWRAGYGACCLDAMLIVENGGSISNLIEFADAKAMANFSPEVSPTNFFPK